ncbi:hypothetical protein LOTGIDRAFT_124521, partial [Lottia gigantea]
HFLNPIHVTSPNPYSQFTIHSSLPPTHFKVTSPNPFVTHFPQPVCNSFPPTNL